MNNFWLLLAFLPISLATLKCNHVTTLGGKIYATDICYKPAQVVGEWWRFECTSSAVSPTAGQLVAYNTSGCMNGTKLGVVPFPLSTNYDCSGQTCGFLKIENCQSNTTREFPHPLNTCKGFTAPATNSSNATALPSSIKYECQNGTIIQKNWIGTASCNKSASAAHLIINIRYSQTCEQPINSVDGTTVPHFAKVANVICATPNPTSSPSSSPSLSPTTKPVVTTTSSNAPGKSTTTTASTTTSLAPSNMSTTSSGNGTMGNTTAIPHTEGGGNEHKKGPNVALIIGLSVGALLLLCLGGVVWWWRRKTGPTMTVNFDAYEPLQQDTHGDAAHQEDAP